MAYSSTNRKRSSTYWSHYWTKKTDIEQLRDNQDAVYDDFDVDHDTTTGKHAVDDIGDWVAGWVDTAFTDLAPANTLNANADAAASTGFSAFTDPTSVTTSTTITEPTGITYIGGIFQCKGNDATGGEAECVMGEVSGGVHNYVIRRTVGTVAGDFKPLSVLTGYMYYRDGAHLVSGNTESPDIVDRNYILTSGAPVTKNHYDRVFENCAAIRAAMDVGHDSGWVHTAITPIEFYGGQVQSCGVQSIDRSVEYHPFSIGAHDGVPRCIMPWRLGISGAQSGHLFLPAWDDTDMYVIVWTPSFYAAPGTTKSWCGGTSLRLDLPAAPSWTGSFDGAFSVAQGDATDLDIYNQLAKNDEILDKLYLARHRGYSGLHAIGLDEVTGYTVVKDNTTETIGGTIGDITTVTLEAWPATNPVYFVGLVGAAGAGIAAVSIGGDETNAKLYIRTVTVGTTSDYTLRVIRVDRV